MRRAALIGILAVLVGIVAWLSLQGSRSHDPGHVSEERIETVAEAPPSSDLDAVESSARRGSIAAAVPEEPAKAVSVTREESVQVYLQAMGQIRLSGTVVVIDEQQVEHRAEDGSFALGLLTDGGGPVVDVKVVGGRWTVDVAPAEELSIDHATLGERRAFASKPMDRIPLPESHIVEFRFRWPPATVLHVRDAASGLDLSGVEAVPSGSWENEHLFVPAPSATKSKSTLRGRSPLAIRHEDLPGSGWVSSLFVRADGYAWTHVKCDPRVGGDVFAELVPACALDVNAEGDKSAEGLRIRLRQAGQHTPMLDMPLAARERLEIESVPPGEYAVSAEIGEWYQQPVVLATSPVTLVARVRSAVRLQLANAPTVATADLSGVLLMPSAWGSELNSIEARLISTATGFLDRDRSVPLRLTDRTPPTDTYSWEMKQAEVGKYQLSLHEPSFACIVELLPGGSSGIQIVVPPPASVSVRVVDAVTNADVVVDYVGWHAKRPPESRSWSNSQAKRNASTGGYEARCPVGEVEFSTFALELGYAPASTTATILLGDNSVVLSLPKGTGMRLIVKDGERDLQYEREFDIEAVAGDGRWMSRSTGPTGTRVQVTEPGKYRVKLKEAVAGYLMPEEQIVDLAAGTMTDVVFRLTRKP